MEYAVEKLTIDAATHYRPLNYLQPWRMAAIGYQVQLVAAHFPRASVLEVGIGSGLATLLLRQAGHTVVTMDLDPALRPTLVGSVSSIPARDGEFDAVLCCQVLEHLPWSEVGAALAELRRVGRNGGLVSVPTTRTTWMLTKFGSRSWGTRRLTLRSWRERPMRWPQEHHWELEANVRTRAFRDRLHTAGFRVLSELQPMECLYHHFFVLGR